MSETISISKSISKCQISSQHADVKAVGLLLAGSQTKSKRQTQEPGYFQKQVSQRLRQQSESKQRNKFQTWVACIILKIKNPSVP